jgi:hypothetical protein
MLLYSARSVEFLKVYRLDSIGSFNHGKARVRQL